MDELFELLEFNNTIISLEIDSVCYEIEFKKFLLGNSSFFKLLHLNHTIQEIHGIFKYFEYPEYNVNEILKMNLKLNHFKFLIKCQKFKNMKFKFQ